MEDKDSLRTMLRHALERPGHTVIEARDQTESEGHVGPPLVAGEVVLELLSAVVDVHRGLRSDACDGVDH